ncbi:hypothetical protein DL766_009815 [Monosporascus sp. MC13-8B]|uniref:Nucleoside phosphorylase domain-containing protein n=1 Tax=Monosporascus cannonballus TaxID=155416 RepID=A0ABY0GT00_9PEZI|nr:hypothetical protein DL762_009688 [Monosporascus cannonballus]RYO85658.1 hypothetical protein DL763_007021 [Monosporascus cannonballus]RYP13723.1 hypothetical protein DL766_009815 [Monosporascus sp. MC13-8B]
MTNQTQILKGCVGDAKLGKIRHVENTTCANAAKFIAHFTSDIAQPLHVSGIAAGGNGVWDGQIIYSLANVTRFGNETIHPFFENGEEGQAGQLLHADGRLGDLHQPFDAAAIFNRTDLVTSGYAEGAWPIVEIQAAKAALRMATWFNKLADGLYKEREVIPDTAPSWIFGTMEGP